MERGWFGRLVQRVKFPEQPLAPANASAHGVHAMLPIEIKISVEQALPLGGGIAHEAPDRLDEAYSGSPGAAAGAQVPPVLGGGGNDTGRFRGAGVHGTGVIHQSS